MLRPIRATGRWHARAGVSDTPFGGPRNVSSRPKSHVHFGDRHHSRQGVLFGNAAVLEYGGLVWLLFHLFVLAYEEPTLRGSFGDEYKDFCATVPRWIPRFTRQPARRGG
jgi:hypothetical protein